MNGKMSCSAAHLSFCTLDSTSATLTFKCTSLFSVVMHWSDYHSGEDEEMICIDKSDPYVRIIKRYGARESLVDSHN